MAKARKPTKKQRVGLTLEEIRFVHNYFSGETSGNATGSYRAAGFQEHASDDALRRAASDLLTKPHIQAYFRKVQNDACDAEMVTTQGIVSGFKRGSEADISAVVGPDGMILPLEQWPDSVRLCVIRFECEEIFETEMNTELVKTKKLVGHKWKVWLENKTECRKVLAQWKRMIGSDAEAPKQEQKPLVVNGADLSKL